MAQLAKYVGNRQYRMLSWLFTIYIFKRSLTFFYDLDLYPGPRLDFCLDPYPQKKWIRNAGYLGGFVPCTTGYMHLESVGG